MSTTEDRLAIRELAERYADAVCRRDADDWGACWAAEGAWDLGRGRVVEGRSKLVPFWEQTMSAFPTAIQLVYGCLVESVEGETATARCWLGEIITDAEGTARSTVGHYHDELVKLEGRWHYLRRRYQTLVVADVALAHSAPFEP